jgi:succinate-semialdehyde dehydrogenase/glutarate-semialdehyde dehydrogenase
MVDQQLIDRLADRLTGSGARITNVAPFTGKPLVTLTQSTPDDVAKAYERARIAQRAWAEVSPAERARPFIALHDKVLGNAELLDLIQAETGKARSSAFEETIDIAGLSLYYGRNAAKFLAPRRRQGALPGATRTWELRQPKGVIAIISPWNYPLSLAVCDLIPALLAGNAVVLKPDTQTALTALRARELLVEAGLPEEVWQVVVGEPDVVGQPLLDEADHVCFTGSTAAGRRIAEAAARRLIGVTLELGGKNPMLVLDDADVAKAARGAMRACFANAGQLCLSMERIYVADKVYDEFVAKLVAETKSLKLATGYGYNYDMGSLTSKRQLDIVSRHVEDARAQGATVLAGGKARPDLGPFCYQPTVLQGVTPNMELYANETFGPVVSVYPVADDDEAVQLANDTEYGLNASVWTRSAERGREVGSRIRCGTVNINEGYGSAYASNDAPMGGMKASGQGRRHGEHGILEYVELQTVARQRIMGFDRPMGVSAKQFARMITMTYKLLKRLRIR